MNDPEKLSSLPAQEASVQTVLAKPALSLEHSSLLNEEELANVTGGGGITNATSILINAIEKRGDTYFAAPAGGTKPQASAELPQTSPRTPPHAPNTTPLPFGLRRPLNRPVASPPGTGSAFTKPHSAAHDGVE